MSIHYGTDLALTAVRSDGRSPLAFGRSMRPYLWIAVVATVVSVLAGSFYVVHRKPRYVAEARLVVENSRLDASRQELFPTASFVDPLIVDSQVEILKSPSLARKTADSLGVEQAIAFLGTGGERTNRWVLIKGFLPVSLSDALPIPSENLANTPLADFGRAVENDLTVKRLGQSTVVTVSFTGGDADLAAKIVNTLVQHYLDDQAASAALSSGAVSAWLRDRVKEAGLKARVVSWALPPTQRSGPRASLVVIAFAGVGGVLGLIGALGLGVLDSRLRDPVSAKAAIGGEFFGALPRFKRERAPRLGHPPFDDVDSNAKPLALSLTVAVEHPRSQVAHLVRRVRAAILRRRPSHHIVGITATMSGEGTTTVAANLAYAAAAGGQQVLLVDANLYKPSLSAALAPDASLGLINILAGQATFHEAVHHTATFTPDLLPCGIMTCSSNAFERVAQMGPLVKAQLEHYDLIVLDLPPMHSATDPVFASLYVDTVVVVVECGMVSAAIAREFLTASGLADKVIGFLFNKVRRRQLGALAPIGFGSARRRACSPYVDETKSRTS